MEKKYKKQFKEIADKLFKINQEAIKDKDDEVRDTSCYILEIIEEKVNL